MDLLKINKEAEKADNDDLMDMLEVGLIENFETIEAPIRHFFTDGIYAREMSAPAGAKIVSLTHKTSHFFILSKGKIAVWINGEEAVIEAPFIGITKSGTRRAGRVIEDVVWTTFHVTDIKPNSDSEEDIDAAVDLIGEEIIDWRENKILGAIIKNNIVNKLI